MLCPAALARHASLQFTGRCMLLPTAATTRCTTMPHQQRPTSVSSLRILAVWQALEDRCNEEIRAARPVQATVLHRGDRDHPLLHSEHLRGSVPSWDAVPELRLLHIQDLDVNACGGTHLASTAELQVCAP